MIPLVSIAADAAVTCTERLLVAAARLHESVTSARARLNQLETWLWWGSALEPVHCPTCKVSGPRGSACACPPKDSRPAPAAQPPYEQRAPGREVPAWASGYDVRSVRDDGSVALTNGRIRHAPGTCAICDADREASRG